MHHRLKITKAPHRNTSNPHGLRKDKLVGNVDNHSDMD